ncbi:hypothetical protein [Herbidospora cretacea]|uniref:hypothetical protein n=1 Tax=Herbidospora cretacea TaxID=28444 RepID=UPI0004C2D121|nr:hypothetical protein [Herbidospora cretacea]
MLGLFLKALGADPVPAGTTERAELYQGLPRLDVGDHHGFDALVKGPIGSRLKDGVDEWENTLDVGHLALVPALHEELEAAGGGVIR